MNKLKKNRNLLLNYHKPYQFLISNSEPTWFGTNKFHKKEYKISKVVIVIDLFERKPIERFK